MGVKANLANAIERSQSEKKIGRSMRYTLCEGHYYVNGEPFDYEDVLLGDWTAERATRALRRDMCDESITIIHCTVYKQYCQMDLLDFWLNAKATSDPKKVNEYFIKGE